MRLLVTGGRTYRDAAAVNAALDAVHAKRGLTAVIHGACHTPINADKLAGQWARDHGVLEEAYPVDHALDGPWPGAGPRRNARMLAESRPDGVVAFPGGPGTRGMCALAMAAGLRVWTPINLTATQESR